MSGNNSIPRRKILWERQLDWYTELVARSIRKRQVDSVLHCLHFQDNASMDVDSYYKVNIATDLF
jgi:hypothetical protein